MYHSVYDSQTWMDRFGDPGFHRHVAIAKVDARNYDIRICHPAELSVQILGLAALRAVDADILPLNVSAYACELGTYATDLRSLVGSPSASLDVALGSLDSAISAVKRATTALDNEVAALKLLPSRHGCSHKAHSINRRLRQFELGFLSDEGLPGRQWYRHLIVAPGLWLGYGASTFPSATEVSDMTPGGPTSNSSLPAQALTLDDDQDAAVREIHRIVCALQSLALRLAP